MLDPWIIEEIRRREEEQRRIREQPVLEIGDEEPPRAEDSGAHYPMPGPGRDAPRGVVIVDFRV